VGYKKPKGVTNMSTGWFKKSTTYAFDRPHY